MKVRVLEIIFHIIYSAFAVGMALIRVMCTSINRNLRRNVPRQMQALLIQYKYFYILMSYLSKYFRLTIIIRYLRKKCNLMYLNNYRILFKSNAFMWKITHRQLHNLLICDFQLSFCTLNHYTKYDLSGYLIILVEAFLWVRTQQEYLDFHHNNRTTYFT